MYETINYGILIVRLERGDSTLDAKTIVFPLPLHGHTVENSCDSRSLGRIHHTGGNMVRYNQSGCTVSLRAASLASQRQALQRSRTSIDKPAETASGEPVNLLDFAKKSYE